mgnify:CR=1 FL=1
MATRASTVEIVGPDGTLIATVRDLTNANPLDVALVDASGNQITSFGGTSMTDDAAFTPATSSVTPAGFTFDDVAPDSVDEGDIGAGRMSANRNQYVTIRDAAGNERGLNVDAAGAIAVTGGGGGTEYTEDAAAAADPVAGAVMLVRRDTPVTTEVSLDGDNVAAKANSAGAQYVELLSGAVKMPGDAANGLDVDVTRLPALVAGTANIGDVDVLTLPALVAGTANIGDVDIVTMPNVVLAAGTNTNEVVGDVAHDAVAAGNPLLICGVAQDLDDTAPPNRVSAEGDATRLATDFDGSLFVIPGGPQRWTYHSNGSTALTDASVHAAPGVGLSLYVETIVFSSGAATAINIFFEEGAATILGPWYLEAVAGRGMSVVFPGGRKITSNTALTVTTSASIAHSVDVSGFTRAD